MAWKQRFESCNDRLMLRVGGPGGALVHWPDRGHDGEYTWCADDPVGEVRELGRWVGDASTVRLYAVIIEAGDTGLHGCCMSTLYDDEVCKQWSFDGDEDH